MSIDKNALSAEFTKHEMNIIETVLARRIEERQTAKSVGTHIKNNID